MYQFAFTNGLSIRLELIDDATLERTEDVVAILELLGAIELVVATDERELEVAIEELLGRELEVTATLLELREMVTTLELREVVVILLELREVWGTMELLVRELEVVGTLEREEVVTFPEQIAPVTVGTSATPPRLST